jgi:peptidyl-prolyl cis-trans isomerase C
MKTRLPRLARLAFAVALVGCNESTTDTPQAAAPTISEGERGTVLAKVGDRVITVTEFEERLNQQAPFARQRYSSVQRKQEFLDGLVRFELLAMEAEARGFDKDPEVQLARKQALVRKLMADHVPSLVKLSDITEADVKAYYDEHLAEFDKPAEVRASHILFTGGDAEARAKATLDELRGKLAGVKADAREVFTDFARRSSQDVATRESGGDLQFFSKPGEARADRGPLAIEVPPPVANAAYALEAVGDLAPAPVQTSAGWHLVQKTGFKRAYKRELAEVQQSIRNKLFRARKQQAMENYVADLKKKSAIWVDDRVLETIQPKAGGNELPLRPPTPALAPQGLDLPGAEGAGGQP